MDYYDVVRGNVASESSVGLSQKYEVHFDRFKKWIEQQRLARAATSAQSHWNSLPEASQKEDTGGESSCGKSSVISRTLSELTSQVSSDKCEDKPVGAREEGLGEGEGRLVTHDVEVQVIDITTDYNRDEKNIIHSVYSVILIFVDFLVVLFKMTLANIEAIISVFLPAQEKEVRGEIVVVTGAGHGIGKELALQYSALGATVVCLDINDKGNKQTVEEISSTGFAQKAHAYTCDVSSRSQVVEVAEKIQREVGEVSVLVNNAGIMPCHSFLTHKETEIRKLFDVNVMAHFWLIEAFLPSMIRRNHGHIVALSSMAGVMGLANLVPYCASKFAVRGLMESLFEEIREDPRNLQIKFTSIFPYIVDTGLCKNPRIRFPTLMKIVPPKEAAQCIIKAMRRNLTELSIPVSLLYINNFFRNFPTKASLLFKDFVDSGLDSHI